MFATTIAALIYQAKNFYPHKQYLLGNVSIILIGLAIFILIEGIKKIKQQYLKR